MTITFAIKDPAGQFAVAAADWMFCGVDDDGRVRKRFEHRLRKFIVCRADRTVFLVNGSYYLNQVPIDVFLPEAASLHSAKGAKAIATAVLRVIQPRRQACPAGGLAGFDNHRIAVVSAGSGRAEIATVIVDGSGARVDQSREVFLAAPEAALQHFEADPEKPWSHPRSTDPIGYAEHARAVLVEGMRADFDADPEKRMCGFGLDVAVIDADGVRHWSERAPDGL